MALLFAEGCGGRQTTDCGNVNGLTVVPLMAVADHTDQDSDSQIFTSVLTLQGGSGCPDLVPPAVVSTWTSNDPAVKVSPASGASTTATCLSATPGNITITATATLPGGRILTSHAFRSLFSYELQLLILK
jgi:hypothetical protein